jgi:DNA-binding transcriptional regulator GbsR (MarR family)
MSDYEFAEPSERSDRERTLTEIIEAIDETNPETKAELSDRVGLSGNYLSELLKDLKDRDLVRKAYVVDDAEIFDAAPELSEFSTTAADRGTTSLRRLFERLDDLDAATRRQYEAAMAAFEGETVDETAADLEPLANERARAVYEELKSMTLSTEWPGNRVAAELSTVVMNLEIVGDRACFLEDVAVRPGTDEAGIVHDRLAELFEDGVRVHDLLRRILFDLELDSLDTLHGVEDEVHRRLNELFELVTTYDPETYGSLASMSRTLEQTIYYWVHTAELAVQLHSGVTPDHISQL